MKNLIDVRVDKRTELMGIMLLISNYSRKFGKLIEECNNKEYRDKVFTYFSRFSKDKTIKLLNEIINNCNFSYDAPMGLMCQLDDKYHYQDLNNELFRDRLNSSQLVLDFLNKLPNFAKKIKFDNFYDSNLEFYNQHIDKVRNLIEDYDIVGFLKNFYKMNFDNVNFIINLMPFATWGNYGSQYKNNFYCHNSLKKNKKKELDFIGDDEFGLLALVVHEFSHSVINPLTDKYYNLKDNIFDNISETMKKQAYDDNKSIINEHIIRAIQYLYLESIIKNDSLYDRITGYEKSNGFIYIDTCIKSIREYLANIDKYDNFEEYFPKILKDIEAYFHQLNNIKK